MDKIAKVVDGLNRLQFFNQRAGRELWADKPKNVQDEDIENADKVYSDAMTVICELYNENERLKAEQVSPATGKG